MLAKAFPDVDMIAAAGCEELAAISPNAGDRLCVVLYIRDAAMTDRWVQNELQLIKLRFPDAPMVLLVDRDDASEIKTALDFGVRGYIPTATNCEVAFAALRLICTGGNYIPAQVFSSPTAVIDSTAKARPVVSDRINLTDRELAVVHLLREGKPNKLIATALKIEESTVKVHVRSVLKKLGVNNRTQAAYVADRVFGPNGSRPSVVNQRFVE